MCYPCYILKRCAVLRPLFIGDLEIQCDFTLQITLIINQSVISHIAHVAVGIIKAVYAPSLTIGASIVPLKVKLTFNLTCIVYAYTILIFEVVVTESALL